MIILVFTMARFELFILAKGRGGMRGVIVIHGHSSCVCLMFTGLRKSIFFILPMTSTEFVSRLAWYICRTLMHKISVLQCTYTHAVRKEVNIKKLKKSETFFTNIIYIHFHYPYNVA